MPTRRSADPVSVQHVWDAIQHCVQQRQMADTKRLVKYMQRMEKCTESQGEDYIEKALQDGLIVALQKVTKSTSKDVVDSYKMPVDDLPELDGKDWYCFECHLAGDVTCCKTCYRVFHAECVAQGRARFTALEKLNHQSDHEQRAQTTKQLTTSIDVSLGGNDSDLNVSTSGTANSSNNDLLSMLESREVSARESHGGTTAIDGTVEYDEGLCSICNILKFDSGCGLDTTEMNYLLKFVTHRIQSWLPTTITRKMADEESPEWMTPNELTWRANHLFFEHKDMSVIEVNINNESYGHLYDFLADVLTIHHNVAVFHGTESQEFGAAELMLRDCIHDLAELKICPDCYKHSNEKVNAKWFCLPCRVPHKLVWAKQKGYPYWPAKVIKEMPAYFDVRFFGGKYERSLLAKSYIKPIDTPRAKLQIKTSGAFNKSVEELKFHQKLLEHPDELEQLIKSSASSKKPKRITPHLQPNKNKSAAVNNVKIKTTTGGRSTNNSNSNVEDVFHFDDSQVFTHPNNFGSSLNRERIINKRKSTSYEGRSRSPKVPKKTVDNKVDKSTSSNSDNHASLNTSSDSVIHISDGDEDEDYSFRNAGPLDYNGSYEQVSSSTENMSYASQVHGNSTMPSVKSENGLQPLDHPFSDSVERMRRKLENLSDKNEIIKCAMECMQSEIDKITNDHNDHLKRLFEANNTQISETKKKQWCYNCEQDAIYHCCWNTAYCSQICQQQHWQAEHKKVCRRKR